MALMALYDRSQWTKPLNDDQRKELIERFQPLTEDERKKVLDAAAKEKIWHPQELRARAVEAISLHEKRDALRNACRKGIAKEDALGFQRYYRHLSDTFLFEVIKDFDPARVRGMDPADAGDQARRGFEGEQEVLYKDRLVDLLADCGLQIEEVKMDKLHQYLIGGKVQLDARDLLTLVFAFLKDPASAPKPKPDSPFTRPLPLDAALKVLEKFRLLDGKVPDDAEALVRNKRISDPQALRALAVDAAIPAAQRRGLVRTIRSTLSSDGGSAHLRGFPQLPETILYEFVNDKRKDLDDLCKEGMGCELRAFAGRFFRDHRDELYIERIREALTARGFALDDQRLQQTYLHMLRQRVPLPAKPTPGAIR